MCERNMEAQAQEIESLIPRSRTKDEALGNAIRAAELFIAAAKLAVRVEDRARLRSKCKELLSLAENLKISENWCPVPSNPSKFSFIAHVSERIISKREEVILLEGSRLNGFVFPPWTSEPMVSDFAVARNGIQYTEPMDLKLSEMQRSMFAGWRRPEFIVNSSHIDFTALSQLEKNIELVQDLTTNCSVVASLCALISRESKGHDLLLSSVVYPYNKNKDRPAVSNIGKYIFRLQFNGCYRKVVIDSRLPISKTQRSLYVSDRNNPLLLWPALVEKSYLKVRGGYDFPGSNSGTDLWVILGWIPEQIFLRSDEVLMEQLWSRLYKAFGYGDVIMTLGTGRLSLAEEKQLGLVGEHDYAILDMIETKSQKLLLIKNPWRNSMIWKGSHVFPPILEKVSSGESSEVNAEAPIKSTVIHGTFWMNFENVIQNFESVYLSWNPGLFRHRQDHHFTWSIPQTKSLDSFIYNPQFILRSRKKESVWILLSRHFSTEEQELSLLPRTTERNNSSPLGYISLYIFNAQGYRVYLSDDAVYRGAFVDSHQTLARTDVLPSISYSIVVAQQGLPLPKYSFTLSFFSQFLLMVETASNQLPYRSTLNGAWNLRTAGGNPNCSTYPINPQYSIIIPSKTNLVLILEADQQDLAIHVQMLWGGGERVTTVTSKDIVGGSGDYRRGCTYASIQDVTAGKYTIVCSTFESGQIGNFTLRVDSSIICETKPLLSEAAGRLSLRLATLKFEGNAIKIRASLVVMRLTKLRLIATAGTTTPDLEHSTSRPSLRISIQRINGPSREILGISEDGEFIDTPVGIRLKDINLNPPKSPHDLWIIVERSCQKKYIESVEVEILSDFLVSVGPWEVDSG